MAAVLAIGVGSATYAFSAGNTTPATYAGDGATAISGYAVTSLLYTLNASTPRNVDSVNFTLTPTAQLATNVKIQVAAAGTWYACSVAAGNVVSCATTAPQATAAGATQLTVVAVQ